MQTIRVVLTTILLGLFGLARPFVNCSAPPGASLDIRTEDQLNISNSISTLLLRNLSDVFGENDRVRRRAGIHQIFHEDAVFYDPKGSVFRGRDEIDRIAGELRPTHLDFRYQPIAEPEETGNGGRVRWVEGRPGEAPAYAGTDFIIVARQSLRIASVTVRLPPNHFMSQQRNSPVQVMCTQVSSLPVRQTTASARVSMLSPDSASSVQGDITAAAAGRSPNPSRALATTKDRSESVRPPPAESPASAIFPKPYSDSPPKEAWASSTAAGNGYSGARPYSGTNADTLARAATCPTKC